MPADNRMAGLKRIASNRNALLFWPSLFFLALGSTLTYKGVTSFAYPGHTGTPALLYWLGGSFVALGVLRIMLAQADKAATQRKDLKKAANRRHTIRRKSRR
jgi:uncharacterized membrane protein HdeD (DUF308 family)